MIPEVGDVLRHPNGWAWEVTKVAKGRLKQIVFISPTDPNFRKKGAIANNFDASLQTYGHWLEAGWRVDTTERFNKLIDQYYGELDGR